MSTRPKFKLVDVPRNDNGGGEGTTQLMNLRSKNLFEIYNAAEIFDEGIKGLNNSDSFDTSQISVKSIILDGYCFVCVDATVHCFRVGAAAESTALFELEGRSLQSTNTLPLLDAPSDICIVPGHKILMFTLRNGSICFFVPEYSKLTSTLSLFKGDATSYKAAFGGFGPFLCVCVMATFDKRCEAKFLKLPAFDLITQGSSVFFGSTRILKTIDQLDHCFVVGDKFGFAFFPKRKETPILKQSVYALHQQALVNEPLVPAHSLPYGVQSVHRIGKLVGVLTQCLECVLFNSLEDLVPAGVFDLGKFKGDIQDFVILDFDGSVLNATGRMVIHINNGMKDKVRFITLIHVHNYRSCSPTSKDPTWFSSSSAHPTSVSMQQLL